MKTCPFFNVCGGCKYDFADADYRANKIKEIKGLPITDDAVWVRHGVRRRADFCFAGSRFGLFKKGSKDIVPIDYCPNLVPEINEILPSTSVFVSGLPTS